jgi:hypothetical protein
MADKAMTDIGAMVGAFLNTAKAEKSNPVPAPISTTSIVNAAIMPVFDPSARISAVDDKKAPAPVPALNPAAELLKRLYGL